MQISTKKGDLQTAQLWHSGTIYVRGNRVGDKGTKKETVPGHDEITNEQIKYGGGRSKWRNWWTYLTRYLKNGKYLKTGNCWTQFSCTKKGDKHKITNYRSISLGATVAKIFSKALEKKLRGILNEQQPWEQAWLRRNFSTTDHLHTINNVIEKC